MDIEKKLEREELAAKPGGRIFADKIGRVEN
jgi:hypothetical protein